MDWDHMPTDLDGKWERVAALRALADASNDCRAESAWAERERRGTHAAISSAASDFLKQRGFTSGGARKQARR